MVERSWLNSNGGTYGGTALVAQFWLNSSDGTVKVE